MSSEYEALHASKKGVDSNTNGLFYQDASCVQTLFEENPWYGVDLVSTTFTISEVRISAREDCCCESYNTII